MTNFSIWKNGITLKQNLSYDHAKIVIFQRMLKIPFIYYIHINERKLFVDFIEQRKNLNYKGSSGKNQKKWDKHFLELKKELLLKYEK